MQPFSKALFSSNHDDVIQLDQFTYTLIILHISGVFLFLKKGQTPPRLSLGSIYYFDTDIRRSLMARPNVPYVKTAIPNQIKANAENCATV